MFNNMSHAKIIYRDEGSGHSVDCSWDTHLKQNKNKTEKYPIN